MIAVSQRIQFTVPVTLTPRRACRIFVRQAIVLLYIASYEELFGVFSTVEHSVHGYSSTWSFLDKSITELHAVGACRKCHGTQGNRHDS